MIINLKKENFSEEEINHIGWIYEWITSRLRSNWPYPIYSQLDLISKEMTNEEIIRILIGNVKKYGNCHCGSIKITRNSALGTLLPSLKTLSFIKRYL